VVFTAGEQEYADAILDQIDPDRAIIQTRLYRQHCVNPQKGVYVKDLRIIKDRQLCDIVIVDNSILSFAYNMDNGVPISAFFFDTLKDEELLYMVGYLESIFSQADIRENIRATFKLS
jgi:CTD small phosphatase-like protein 2